MTGVRFLNITKGERERGVRGGERKIELQSIIKGEKERKKEMGGEGTARLVKKGGWRVCGRK